jgi:hypothetical protein
MLIKYNSIEGDNNELEYSFLGSGGNIQHIKNILNEMLNKDHILIHWSAAKGDTVINGITTKKCNFNNLGLSLKYLRTVLKHTCITTIDNKKLNNQTLVSIKLTCENLFEVLPDLINYEIFISDDDYEFNWIGLKSHKISVVNLNPLELTFKFITDKKGLIDLNKINISLLFKNTDKNILLNNFPKPIFIDIN